MIYIPKSTATNNKTRIFSSIGKPGGGGGLLPVGGGGCGAANALETPKRYIIIMKNLFAIIFIFKKINAL